MVLVTLVRLAYEHSFKFQLPTRPHLQVGYAPSALPFQFSMESHFVALSRVIRVGLLFLVAHAW